MLLISLITLAEKLNTCQENNYYSETPPYGHLSNTVTSLLQPLFLAAWQNGHTFSGEKTLVNMVTK